MQKRIFSFTLILSIVLSLCSFNAYAKAPGVQTMIPINVTDTSAVLRGYVTSNSGIKIKEYGFKFVDNYNVSKKKMTTAEHGHPINDEIIQYTQTGLKAGTRYDYHFYAINENGEETTGPAIQFTTAPAKNTSSGTAPTVSGNRAPTLSDTKKPNIDDFDCSEGPTSHPTFDEGTKVEFYAIASDNDEIDEMVLYIDGKEVEREWDDDISYETSSLTAGEHIIKVTVTDVSGNKREETMTVTVIGTWDEEDSDDITLPTQGGGFTNTPQQGNGTTNPDGSWGNTKDEEVVESHTHIPTDYYQTTKYEIISGDDTYHRLVPYYNTECATCYETLKTNVRGESTKEKHVFYYNECGVCGYEKEEIVVATPAPTPKNETSISDFHEKAYNNASSYGGIKVYVNGSKLYFDVEPEIKNGRTMVPLRAIFEALGAEVEWDGATSTVYAYRGNESVELTIGSYYLYTSSGVTTLDQPGYITNGRTLVPVRAISEAFNCDVQWYQEKQLVSIVAKDREYQTDVSNDSLGAEQYLPNESHGTSSDNQKYNKISKYPTPLITYTLYDGSDGYTVPMYTSCSENSNKVANNIAALECKILEFYDNGWCKVTCASGTGYVQIYRFIQNYDTNKAVSPYTKDIAINGTIKVNIREGVPSENWSVSISGGDSPLTVVADDGNAHQIIYYVPKYNTYKMGWVEHRIFEYSIDNSGNTQTATGTVAEMLAFAKSLIDNPNNSYVSGGAGESNGKNGQKFDCSGFTQYVFKQFGIDLPKYSGDQASAATKVPNTQVVNGTITNIQPGDILFSNNGESNHVVIYAGNNTYYHAANPTGGLKVGKFYPEYLNNEFISAHRYEFKR